MQHIAGAASVDPPPDCRAGDAMSRVGRGRRFRLRRPVLQGATVRSATLAVQRRDDDADALGVPSLNSFVVGVHLGCQPTPGEQVLAGQWVDKRASVNDPAQHQPTFGDQRNPGERLIHAVNARGARHGSAGPIRESVKHVFRARHRMKCSNPQPGAVAGVRQAEQSGSCLLQPRYDPLGGRWLAIGGVDVVDALSAVTLINIGWDVLGITKHTGARQGCACADASTTLHVA